MYCEDVLAELIGCPREDIAAVREEVPGGSWTQVKRRVLWTFQGVKALLAALEIPEEKVPEGWFAALEREAAFEVQVERELVIARTTANPNIVLARWEGGVVRVRIRPTEVEKYRPGLVQKAVLERNGMWRARGLPRRLRKGEEVGA